MIEPSVLATTTIWQEARGESFIGKLAVAIVIRNRMKRKYQSDGSVAGTVLKAKQFSGWNEHNKDRILSTTVGRNNTEYLASSLAWQQSEPSTRFSAVLYHSKSIDPPKWASHPNVKKVAEIGNHIFYDEVTE